MSLFFTPHFPPITKFSHFCSGISLESIYFPSFLSHKMQYKLPSFLAEITTNILCVLPHLVLPPLYYIPTLPLELPSKSKCKYIYSSFVKSIVLQTKTKIINMAQKALWNYSLPIFLASSSFIFPPSLCILTTLAFLQVLTYCIGPPISWSSHTSFPSTWHSNFLLMNPNTHTCVQGLAHTFVHHCTPGS